ncbi:outer membrane protein [Helicobacter cetorum]|uniref:Outer membrane protein HopF, putative signal peptide n=1 Tax=Helicobacter cetorum (strain ATCC BAA-429 / MIT 00-7128) TaxID=182217 RepID=I0EPI2_HELC0|nr:outer membrane protein [Helicobacter cetorum]AFI04851.1 Outer membrane protein HopF, putative signal peptide [Helicobacter cetorum MIT 00-7128]
MSHHTIKLFSALSLTLASSLIAEESSFFLGANYQMAQMKENSSMTNPNYNLNDFSGGGGNTFAPLSDKRLLNIDNLKLFNKQQLQALKQQIKTLEKQNNSNLSYLNIQQSVIDFLEHIQDSSILTKNHSLKNLVRLLQYGAGLESYVTDYQGLNSQNPNFKNLFTSLYYANKILKELKNDKNIDQKSPAYLDTINLLQNIQINWLSSIGSNCGAICFSVLPYVADSADVYQNAQSNNGTILSKLNKTLSLLTNGSNISTTERSTIIQQAIKEIDLAINQLAQATQGNPNYNPKFTPNVSNDLGAPVGPSQGVLGTKILETFKEILEQKSNIDYTPLLIIETFNQSQNSNPPSQALGTLSDQLLSAIQSNIYNPPTTTITHDPYAVKAKDTISNSPSALQTILQTINNPHLNEIYAQIPKLYAQIYLNGNFKNNSSALAAYYDSIIPILNELQESLTNMPISKETTSALFAINQLFTLNGNLYNDIQATTQTDNSIFKIASWACSVFCDIESMQGFGQYFNSIPIVNAKGISNKQLYQDTLQWFSELSNLVSSLISDNKQEIGKAINKFSNYYNTMWSKYPHFQQGSIATTDNTFNANARAQWSYPNKDQIKQILNNINTSLPKADQQTLHFTFMALPTNSTTLSQQHQATYNTLQSSKPIALASLSTLASMFNQMNYLSSPTTKLTNNDKDIESTQQGYMLGFGIKGGYKQMFNHYIKGNRESKKKYGQLGLRYYAFLDYNYGVLNQRNTNKENMNMLTYGVGLDILVNIFENKLASYGIFGGFQIAGNSWLATKNYSSSIKDKIRATHFQCLFDFGLRSNILKHHGIELGVKIPMLSQKYIDTANYKVNYKREFVYYVGYVWGF